MKTVLVTGSSSGIGKETVKKFAKNNYNVVITYNNDYNGAIELEKEIKERDNVDTLVIECDISDEDKIKEMVEKVIFKFNKIDVLVNNAGIAIDTTFEDKTKDNFMKTLEINLVGTFLVSKYVSKYMLEQKSGNIVNVASTNGIDSYYVESLDYDVSKSGVISLTHNLANYLAPNIRVNCVCPGWINTKMNDCLSTEFKTKETEKILLSRFAEPEEVANLIYFLASDEAGYINDSIIKIDGGVKHG